MPRTVVYWYGLQGAQGELLVKTDWERKGKTDREAGLTADSPRWCWIIKYQPGKQSHASGISLGNDLGLFGFALWHRGKPVIHSRHHFKALLQGLLWSSAVSDSEEIHPGWEEQQSLFKKLLENIGIILCSKTRGEGIQLHFPDCRERDKPLKISGPYAKK